MGKDILLTILITGGVEYTTALGQTILPGFPVLEEVHRRNQLLDDSLSPQSFNLRPIFTEIETQSRGEKSAFRVGMTPMLSTTQYNSKRPFGWGDYSMIPSVGFQQYFTAGIFGSFKMIHYQIQPEFVFAENSRYVGFDSNSSPDVIRNRFRYWNFGDSPEVYGNGPYSKFWWGNTSLTVRFGSLELGGAVRNIWWGPGQFNSLTFSNNAPSFPHLSINTFKPARTFAGDIEFQLIVGKLMDSGIAPFQDQFINDTYFESFNGDWRYLNGLLFSYHPKWVKGLYMGFSRTFQRYSNNEFNTFRDYFPVFEGLQKIKFLNGGNFVEYDSDKYDQQFTVHFRYLVPSFDFEFYSEFGRRDHSLNLRELVLNPEHARAFLLGFIKLVPVHSKRFSALQIRGEITHQQESVNRYIRYPGLGGGTSWHTHYQARGFSNQGQALGVGIGTGSNSQNLEVSLVNKFNKVGLLLQRIENHQDFFYRSFGNNGSQSPWIDLGLGFLLDLEWNEFVFSSKFTFVNAQNYQWLPNSASTPEFPRNTQMISSHIQINAIYRPNFKYLK